MSDVIRLLPDSVANQIAAGEVIQRPANVVKELMENSIDAGATSIDVYILDAGRTLIQVTDNGKGMSETDARLAFERHATSKIRSADDLYMLRTMGFRGEALPSVAAVAMVELRTRQAADELGTELILSGSKVVSQKLCACPAGCNIKVQSIFFNVPARRKFLKSDATELNNIVAAFERIALVYPQTAFSLHSNDNELFRLAPGNLHKRIEDIFGKKLSRDLLPVDAQTGLCNISGFVGKPEAARKKCSAQYFFVNGRFMKHAYFAKAVAAAFERLIPAGAQVPYFIYIDTDPAAIDVNIHPSKTEIKFENEQAVWQILAAAVREAVGIFSELPTIDFDSGKPDIPVLDPENEGVAVLKKEPLNPSYNPFLKPVSLPRPEQESASLFPPDDIPAAPAPAPVTLQTGTFYQHKGQYIVAQAASGIIIIDQHRAHVRVLYERYEEKIERKSPSPQRLLFPEAVQFAAADSALCSTIIAEMERFGFELSPLGGGSYAINAVPAGLEGINPSVLVADMMEDAVQAGVTATDAINRTLAISLARKAAIPCGQVLSEDEAAALVAALFACKNCNYTPDGKKTFILLDDEDVKRFFT
ncbi:MAG: DNA mismatch repair endonuclease MutL [Prevotella sp.]|nr:DNA mismatch repair endonuclease MutL [Prevotella sp.]